MKTLAWALTGSLLSAGYWMVCALAVYVFAQGDVIPGGRAPDPGVIDLRKVVVIGIFVLVYAVLLVAWRWLVDRMTR